MKNVAPTITEIIGETEINEGEEVIYSAIASDPGNDTLTYSWDFGDGNTAEGKDVNHTFTDNGNYSVALTVTDSDGASITSTLEVQVNNLTPVIKEINSDTSVIQGGIANFSAIASDPGNDTLTYSWDFGDGSSIKEGQNVSHIFAHGGNYNVTLNVTDKDGGTISETIEITISSLNEGEFIVDDSGIVKVDYLFDGGGYWRGELAIFSLEGMENYIPGSKQYIKEAARRARSNSELGYVVISDQHQGARFSGKMANEAKDWNYGDYQGNKSFSMPVGTKFAVMLIPNHKVGHVWRKPWAFLHSAIRPLFSIPAANSHGDKKQFATLFKGSNVFAVEDKSLKSSTDRDYNDLIFELKGATSQLTSIDDVINPDVDWRQSDIGKAIIDYAIGAENYPPVVDAGSDINVLQGAMVTFNGSFEDPNYFDSHTINWDFGDGTTNSENLNPSHTYNVPGTYQVTLSVTDSEGSTTTDNLQVVVDNVPPVIEFLTGESSIRPGESTNFSASATDPGNDTLTYSWDFGDGNTAEGENVTHTFTDNGNYSVTLTVTDSDGASTSQTLEVQVNNLAPILNEGEFIVDDSGIITVDYLFDGGGYGRGELAIFSLELDSLLFGA